MSEAGSAGGGGRESGVELTAEQLVEEFRKIKVSDLVASTVLTLSQIGYGKLDPASRDLEQARLAIESIRVLIPVIEASVAKELVRDFNQVLANLQLAYAKAIRDAGEARPPAEESSAPREEAASAADEGNEPTGAPPANETVT